MLTKIQPNLYHKEARFNLQQIKHSLKLFNHISKQLVLLSEGLNKKEFDIFSDKNEKIKSQIKDRIKAMGTNLDLIAQLLDHKLQIICRELNKLQSKIVENSSPKKAFCPQLQQKYKYQINQLQQRIFNLQKCQNQYVKQVSQLKQRNLQLRQQFSSLSLGSNQRIKQLSQKLHNNTSPDLGIKRYPTNNLKSQVAQRFQTSYVDNQNSRNSIKKNNFVKIKNHEQIYEQSPVTQYKRKNLVDSMVTESDYAIPIQGKEHLSFQSSSGNLKFGCFPAKHHTQKTKTSSDNNKKQKSEKSDKNRRFQFLLNNLIDNKTDGPVLQDRKSGKKQIFSQQNEQQQKSVFSQNIIKRYQI